MKVIILSADGVPLINGGLELINIAAICRALSVNRNTFNSMIERYGSVAAAIRQVKKKK
jgi:hypothetical protein